MAKDLSTTEWHGIPRKEIPWHPTINEEQCIGCELCYVSCGREVFEYDDSIRKAIVERPYNCMVGCSTCGTICPSNAISFPPREMIQRIEKEHKILKVVRKTAREKKTKKAYEEARAKVEKMLDKIQTAIEFEVTGHFAERQIMSKIYQAIEKDPCDLVYINIQTPTLRGCWNEKAPSYAKFRLVSTEYAEIKPFEEKVIKILEENDILVIAKRKVG